jgi:hypothetical protein
VSYPLAGRGLVALTGRNEDDGSAESNGAGKTSLATALLWAMKAEVTGLILTSLIFLECWIMLLRPFWAFGVCFRPVQPFRPDLIRTLSGRFDAP